MNHLDKMHAWNCVVTLYIYNIFDTESFFYFLHCSRRVTWNLADKFHTIFRVFVPRLPRILRAFSVYSLTWILCISIVLKRKFRKVFTVYRDGTQVSLVATLAESSISFGKLRITKFPTIPVLFFFFLSFNLYIHPSLSMRWKTSKQLCINKSLSRNMEWKWK